MFNGDCMLLIHNSLCSMGIVVYILYLYMYMQMVTRDFTNNKYKSINIENSSDYQSYVCDINYANYSKRHSHFDNYMGGVPCIN